MQQLCRHLPATRRERHGYLELYDGARRHWIAGNARRRLDEGRRAVLARRGASAAQGSRASLVPADCLRRAETHKAMNALIQGSAARHTKLWMRACGAKASFRCCRCTTRSTARWRRANRRELVARLGCEAVRLEVPMRVDLKFGRNWGDAKTRMERD